MKDQNYYMVQYSKVLKEFESIAIYDDEEDCLRMNYPRFYEQVFNIPDECVYNFRKMEEIMYDEYYMFDKKNFEISAWGKIYQIIPRKYYFSSGLHSPHGYCEKASCEDNLSVTELIYNEHEIPNWRREFANKEDYDKLQKYIIDMMKKKFGDKLKYHPSCIVPKYDEGCDGFQKTIPKNPSIDDIIVDGNLILDQKIQKIDEDICVLSCLSPIKTWEYTRNKDRKLVHTDCYWNQIDEGLAEIVFIDKVGDLLPTGSILLETPPVQITEQDVIFTSEILKQMQYIDLQIRFALSRITSHGGYFSPWFGINAKHIRGDEDWKYFNKFKKINADYTGTHYKHNWTCELSRVSGNTSFVGKSKVYLKPFPIAFRGDNGFRSMDWQCIIPH